jgi:hypothetical protein
MEFCCFCMGAAFVANAASRNTKSAPTLTNAKEERDAEFTPVVLLLITPQPVIIYNG